MSCPPSGHRQSERRPVHGCKRPFQGAIQRRDIHRRGKLSTVYTALIRRLILRLLYAIASGKPLKGCADVEPRQGQSWIGGEDARDNEQADKGQMSNTLEPCIVNEGLFSPRSAATLLRVQYVRCCIGLTLLSCVSLKSCRYPYRYPYRCAGGYLLPSTALSMYRDNTVSRSRPLLRSSQETGLLKSSHETGSRDRST